jgi:membrane protein DedA with SNARE-associated domain/rhodanese-related sulfurtransferase
MDLVRLTEALRQDAVAIVFFNVLLQQLGLPVPAVPTLLLAGSLSAAPGQLGKILAAAVLASVIADWIWFTAGKLFGYRLLAGLCRLSINPASCVSQTEARFTRWGVTSLVVAKFIPGFSTVAPPIAGALRMNEPGFLLAAGLGAGLWAALPLAAGWMLKDAVGAVIIELDQHTGTVLFVGLLLIGVWFGWKLWQKYKFRRLSAIPHITANELIAALKTDRAPLLLDIRGAAIIGDTGPIAGARVADHRDLKAAVGDWPKNEPIVTLCACPEDAGAIQAANYLLNEGYVSVRPLRGGYDAWLVATATHRASGD